MMDTALQIGQKIKYYRTIKKLTIKELAANAQITTSMLSQIERGQANPSLNTIRLLSVALDEPIFRFFVDEQDMSVRDEIVRADKRRQIIEESVQYELLTPDTNGALEMMQMKVVPGRYSNELLMAHIGEEVAFVTSGPIQLLLENETCTLNTGDSVRIKSSIKHRWYNPGEKDALVVFAITPPSF